MDSARQAVPRPPVPAPSIAGTASTQGLTDHSDELIEIGLMPLEERAAALSSLYEELTSVLHEAED